MATVLDVMDFSIWLASIQKENFSTSTKTGIKLFFTKHPTVVENVRAGVITSDPSAKLRASMPTNNAEEPEFTYKQYFFIENFSNFFLEFSRIITHLCGFP